MKKLQKNFEPSHDGDVINKAYLYEKISKLEGHISYKEKDSKEFKLLGNSL